jgi:hypothetical protein
MGDDPRLFTLTGPDGETIARGSMSAVTEPILDSVPRSDAADLLIDAARACGLIESIAEREDAVRAAQAQQLFDGIANIERRMDAFVERRAEIARQDAEREQREIQKMLDALPDPDDPTPHDGDLSALGPVDKERYGGSNDDQGDLPRELQEGVPPLSGNYIEPDPAELGRPQDPKQVPQPIAISLNAEDDNDATEL